MSRLRRFYWQRIRRYRSEICRDCGRPVRVVWTAPNDAWKRVWGDEGSILCIPCFDARYEAKYGVLLRWVPHLQSDPIDPLGIAGEDG